MEGILEILRPFDHLSMTGLPELVLLKMNVLKREIPGRNLFLDYR